MELTTGAMRATIHSLKAMYGIIWEVKEGKIAVIKAGSMYKRMHAIKTVEIKLSELRI